MTQSDQTGEVVPLQSMLSQAREAQLKSFVAYWDSLRRDGDVPRRSEIDPRRIEGLLEEALIAEKIAPGLARLRIAGAHLSAVMGMEVRGMPLSALVVPQDRTVLADALTELFERPARIELALQAPQKEGGMALTGRLVLLPLRSDLGDVSRALGCLVTQGPLGRAPCRFTITQRRITAVEAYGVTPPAPTPTRSFAEAATPYEAQTELRSSERPYLRLVR